MAGKKNKKKKAKGSSSMNKIASLLHETRVSDAEAFAVQPTVRVTPRIPIPRQLALVQTHGCSLAGGVHRRLIPRHQPKYHPWSTTRKCARSGLLSAVAWHPTRIRNTILAVGPGTPAHVLWGQRFGDAEFDSERIEAFHRHLDRRDMMMEEDSMVVSYASDMEGDQLESMDKENESVHSEGSQDDEDIEDDEQGEEIEITGGPLPHSPPQGPVAPPRLQQQLEQPTTVDWLPSMRHDGCVNTASWLNCPWRLSRGNGGMSYSSGTQVVLPKGISSSYDLPTQVMTSGDDGMIKVWDLADAMGSASPLPGGWDTFSPFTTTNIKELGSDEQKESWKKYYEERKDNCKVASSVGLLASVQSKHRGNVVHVSPIANAPGKALSCGTDGFLRLSDLVSGTSTVVIDPHIHDDFEQSFTEMAGGGFGVNAFSHLSLTGNTGLLCCQRGLFRFDLRLSPNRQPRTSLLNPVAPGSSRSLACRACAVWSPTSYKLYDSYPAYMTAQSEPSYIFVGADIGFVELLDLRMLSNSSSQEQSIVQRYSPTAFGGLPSAPVCGIDVSRDGRELLVSYESDQIYTYPICSNFAYCSAGPSKTELDYVSTLFRDKKNGTIPQMASYGGHVTRGSFLKNATYAGPNDEYIVTGSDSGMAFIFDRSTTCVAAVLSSDSCACNGIVVHPTLPYFVTYGIDSSAKLWRACASKDSRAARAKASVEIPEYELSAVTRQWSRVQASLHRFIESEIALVLPDLIASDEVCGSSVDLDMMDLVNGSKMKPRGEYGNALRCLSPLLRQTKYRCFRAHREDHRPPITTPISLFAITIAWNRLRLQALSMGMEVNPWAPWVFENKNPFHRVEDTFGFHKADLVPDHPSDWIYFDPQMILYFAINFHCIFNVEGFSRALQQTFPENPVFFGAGTIRENFIEEFAEMKLPWISDKLWESNQFEYSEDVRKRTELKESWSLSVFEETIAVLKDGGNEAMKLGLYYKAAQRYDKGIQYCAVALMEHPMAIPNHPEIHSVGLVHIYRNRSLPSSFFATKIEGYKSMVIKDGTSPYIYWSSVLQSLIALRLNLSLLLLKPEFGLPVSASEQASEVLKLLTPFVTRPCLVVGEGSIVGKDDVQEFGKPEPISTFRQAKPLQAKAYYRLGCAQFELQDYRKAVKSFRSSLECTQEAKCDRWGKALGSVQPNPLVLQRIEEAETKLNEEKKVKKKSK